MSVVYCIGERPGGPVKVGYAADASARLGELQVGNHLPLRIIWEVPGDTALERSLHAKFGHLRIRGEWFMDCHEVISSYDARTHAQPPEVPPQETGDLRADIAEYCQTFGLTRSAFGQCMMGDPRFVFDLEKGRDLRRSTETKLRLLMQSPPSEGALVMSSPSTPKGAA